MNIIFYLKADKVICNRSSSLGYNDGMVGQEITASTLRNFAKAIKLFCEMCDVPIAWKKISRGLPKIRRFADDRAPTIEEIQSICDYPDRRIKGIVSTMASSGIRLGAWHYLRWGHIKPVEKERAHFDTGLMYKITRYNTTISQEKIVRTEGCSEVCPDTTHIKGTGCAICGFLGFRCNTSGLGLTLFGVLKN